MCTREGRGGPSGPPRPYGLPVWVPAGQGTSPGLGSFHNMASPKTTSLPNAQEGGPPFSKLISHRKVCVFLQKVVSASPSCCVLARQVLLGCCALIERRRSAVMSAVEHAHHIPGCAALQLEHFDALAALSVASASSAAASVAASVSALAASARRCAGCCSRGMTLFDDRQRCRTLFSSPCALTASARAATLALPINVHDFIKKIKHSLGAGGTTNVL